MNEAAPAQNRSERSHLAPGWGFWALMGLTLLAVGTVAYLQYARVDEARRLRTELASNGQLPILGQVSAFSLTERDGRPFGLDDLRGRIWVADFIFTSCTGPCPVMSRRMQDLQNELLREGLEKKVVSVSFSVDPEVDTPAVLREYADTRGASAKRWLFLTGDKKAIRDLCINDFKLAVQDPVAPDQQIIHSSRFVLVDRKGQIRGYYRVLTDDEEADPAAALQRPMAADEKSRLFRDIRALVREGGR